MFKRFKKAAAAICAASMVLSMTACGSAGDKKVELHFTHTQSPGSISDLTAQEFKRLVEERSGGRIKVNIYSNCGFRCRRPIRPSECRPDSCSASREKVPKSISHESRHCSMPRPKRWR